MRELLIQFTGWHKDVDPARLPAGFNGKFPRATLGAFVLQVREFLAETGPCEKCGDPRWHSGPCDPA